jgi:hypothetical protein
MKKLLLIIFLFMFTSCIGTPPTPEDNVPQCCRGQETHTCGMPGMTGKPLPLPKGRGK